MEIKDVIYRFKSPSGFIENINFLVDTLKSENLSSEEIIKVLTEVLKYNQSLNSKLEKENLEFEKMFANRKSLTSDNLKVSSYFEMEEEYNKSSDSGRDISYYKIQIDNCTDLNKLESLLPKRNVENFEELMDYILASLLEEEMEFRKLLYDSSIPLESDIDILNYVNEIHEKFEMIKNYRDYKKTTYIEEATSNHLIFLTTAYGNVCAISDLKDIDESNYENLLKLFNSIIDGTFKNVKSFTLFKSGNMISEVKGFQQRICFDKLDTDVYIITSIFTKKTDNGLSYRNNLINRDSLYRSMESKIKAKLKGKDREKLLRENDLIKEDVISLLKSGIKVKSLGGNNGKIS